MSQPCCINAPSENHRELKMPKSLVYSGVSFSFCWFWFCPWAWENPNRGNNQKYKRWRFGFCCYKNKRKKIWHICWDTWRVGMFCGWRGLSSSRRRGSSFIFIIRLLTVPFVRTEPTHLFKIKKTKTKKNKDPQFNSKLKELDVTYSSSPNSLWSHFYSMWSNQKSF